MRRTKIEVDLFEKGDRVMTAEGPGVVHESEHCMTEADLIMRRVLIQLDAMPDGILTTLSPCSVLPLTKKMVKQ